MSAYGRSFLPLGPEKWCPRPLTGGVRLWEVTNIGFSEGNGRDFKMVSAYKGCPLTRGVR